MYTARILIFNSNQLRVNVLLKSYCLSQNYSRTFKSTVTLHGKIFKEVENIYAYNTMTKNGYAINLDVINNNGVSDVQENIYELMQKDWKNENASNLYKVFCRITALCSSQNICISNKMFDNFIDSLTDNMKYLSDEELKNVFYLLKKWPETDSVRTRNYIEVWAALDDECIKRMNNWSFDITLQFLSLMYMLSVTKMCDFAFKSLQRFTSKAKQLTPAQLVQTLFFMGTLRKQTKFMHNLEVHLGNNISHFTVDELAIMSMGFFKSQTPIRQMDIVEAIIEKIIENSHSIHEISLAALLKVIRYSMKIHTKDSVYRLLDALAKEVPRLSVMCCVHVALVGTATITFHKTCLNEIAKHVINNLPNARLKDLERLTFVFGTFNFIPDTTVPFFETILIELRSPNRDAEIRKYSRSLANCIAFMAMTEIYPKDMINKILDPEFLEATYGTAVYNYGREILTLHNVGEIFFEHQNLNRLKKKTVSILAKKYTDYVPNVNYKKEFNVTEKMMIDVINVLKQSRGEEYVQGDHILTHYQRGDIIICNDRKGIPVNLSSFNSNANFGPVVRPPDNNTWIVLVIAGRNAFIRNTDKETGPFNAKIKQLKAIGYHPILVNWSTWSTLTTFEEKNNYLNDLILNGVNN